MGSFLDTCVENTHATFQNQREWYERLSDIDDAYHRLVHNLDGDPELNGGFLACRSHCAFLGACRLSLAGQVPETYMVLRGCLEAALYGLYLAKNPASQRKWFNRHETDNALKAVKSEFTVSRLKECLAKTDPDVHARLAKWYDYTIDLGGHPNVMSVESHLESSGSDNASRRLAFRYLHPPSDVLLATFKACAVVGITGLDVFRHVFPRIYAQVELDTRLAELKQGL